MKIEFDFDINDWEAFQRYYFANSPTYRRRKRIMLYLYLFILTFACCMSLRGTMLFIILPIAIVLWVLFMRLFYDKILLSRAKLKMQTNSSSQNSMLGRMEFDFNSDGFWMKTPLTDNFITWNELEYVDENENFFFLHKNENEVCIIPKQKIASQLEELNRLLEENVVIHEEE